MLPYRYDALPPLVSYLDPGMQCRSRPASDPAAALAASPAASPQQLQQQPPPLSQSLMEQYMEQQQYMQMSYATGAHTVARRLGITRSWLLERDATTYEVAERRPLG